MVYRRKSDRLINPGPLMGELQQCREAAIRASSSVKPQGVHYHALKMVVVAIDGAATVITGQPYFFSAGGSAMTEGERQRQAAQSAFERGEDGL